CLVFKAGSARDPQGKAGLADFVIELLRRGTERLTADQIDEALETMGVDLHLETSPDSTYVMATAPAEHLAPLLRMLAELVQRPAFAPAEVRQARKRAVARLETELDEPAILAADALGLVALPGHPYGHPGRGTVSQVGTFTRADCVAFAKAHYRPSQAILAIAGDVPADEALAVSERELGRWRGDGQELEPIPAVQPLKQPSVLLVDKKGSNQAQVRLASWGPGITWPDSLAARLSCQALGGGFTSRLVEAIRVNRGLSYGVSGFLTDTIAGSLFVVASYTKTESVRELVEVALEEVRRYRQEGPNGDELLRAKRYTNGLFPLMIETDELLARAIADLKRLGRPEDWLETFRERVLRVDLEQALETARRYFLPGPFAATVVGEAKGLSKQLRGLGRLRVIPAESLA
ncbi:MAG: M16 family metallopeptidase, partial [Myxococcales bacterium]